MGAAERFVYITQAEVRSGSLADIGVQISDLRFTPESGHRARRGQCRLGAMCGRLRLGKSKHHVAAPNSGYNRRAPRARFH